MSAQLSVDSAVCSGCVLDGRFEVKIGKRVVVHPSCTIRALHGPVTIGDGCVLEELSVVETSEACPEVDIGGGTHVRVGAVVQGAKVKDYAMLEVMAQVGEGCIVGSGAVVGVGVNLEPGTTLEDEHVAFRIGNKVHTRKQDGLKKENAAVIEQQLDCLLPCIKKYNQIMT